MTKEELQELYKKKIIPESKEPYHFQDKSSSGEGLLAYNPICGDKFRLFLNKTEHKLKSAHFHGFGCAISKASTSILMKHVEGKSEEEIRQLCKDFLESLESDETIPLDHEELQILSALKNFDGRMDCVKLSWEALYNYLTD